MQSLNQVIQQNPNTTMVWDSYGGRYTATPNGGQYTVSAQSQFAQKNCGTASNAQEIIKLFLNS